MATVKDITAMCKAGDVAKAYQQAKADLGEAPQDVWAQREMGWALYYLLKTDLDNNDRGGFLAHAEELADHIGRRYDVQQRVVENGRVCQDRGPGLIA
mgnify:CR=1 FL=1